MEELTKKDPYLTEREIAGEEEKERERNKYLEYYRAKTEKELLAEQTHLAHITSRNISSIKGMVTFFVWLTCIGIVAWLIILFA